MLTASIFTVAGGASAAPLPHTAAPGYRLLSGDGGVFSFASPFEGSAASDPTRCPANPPDRSMPHGSCWSMASTAEAAATTSSTRSAAPSSPTVTPSPTGSPPGPRHTPVALSSRPPRWRSPSPPTAGATGSSRSGGAASDRSRASGMPRSTAMRRRRPSRTTVHRWASSVRSMERATSSSTPTVVCSHSATRSSRVQRVVAVSMRPWSVWHGPPGAWAIGWRQRTAACLPSVMPSSGDRWAGCGCMRRSSASPRRASGPAIGWRRRTAGCSPWVAHPSWAPWVGGCSPSPSLPSRR